MKTEDLSKVKKAKGGTVDEKDLAILKEAGVSESELATVFENASKEDETSTEGLPTFAEILAALEEEDCHDIAVRLHEVLVEK
jgi:hypothetical protein